MIARNSNSPPSPYRNVGSNHGYWTTNQHCKRGGGGIGNFLKSLRINFHDCTLVHARLAHHPWNYSVE